MKAWKKSRQAQWKKRNPWARFLEYARRRCNETDPNGDFFPHYAARGVKCTLTLADVEEAWLRDKAHLLKRPSLDRVRSEGHYERTNIRFIEHLLNSRLPHDPRLSDEATPSWVTEHEGEGRARTGSAAFRENFEQVPPHRIEGETA